MRVYISGAITGVKDYEKEFAKAEIKLTEEGFIGINPVYLDLFKTKLNYEEFMKLDLVLLDMCDAIYMLDGWENSKGANREYGYALAKNKIIMYEKGA